MTPPCHLIVVTMSSFTHQKLLFTYNYLKGRAYNTARAQRRRKRENNVSPNLLWSRLLPKPGVLIPLFLRSDSLVSQKIPIVVKPDTVLYHPELKSFSSSHMSAEALPIPPSCCCDLDTCGVPEQSQWPEWLLYTHSPSPHQTDSETSLEMVWF